jgi:GxxExxY protein
MNENDIAKVVVDVAYQIHKKTGPGLLESAYEIILSHELKKRGIKFERQVPIPIIYDELEIEEGFRADMIIEKKVILELKSVEEIHPLHKKQLLTYLRLSGYHLGLIINFGALLIKDGIARVVNQLPE